VKATLGWVRSPAQNVQDALVLRFLLEWLHKCIRYSSPYLISSLRLRNVRSRNVMYDSAKYIIGMPKILR
jgi:hypothetical protein